MSEENPDDIPDNRWEEVRRQCKAFHLEHPEVYELFEKYTFDRIALGFQHYSAAATFHHIRWETEKPDPEDNKFKLNNNFHSLYGEKFMGHHREHKGFYRTRKKTSKDRPATNKPEAGPNETQPTNDPSWDSFRGACRSCQAPMVWMITRNDKTIPVDLSSIDPAKKMEFVFSKPLFSQKDGHIAHFTTCPNADKHRR